MDVLYGFLSVLLLLALVLLGNALVSIRGQQAQRLRAIERRLRQITEHLGVPDHPHPWPEVIRHLDAGKKIAAIKAYRDATGADLAQAKRAVESFDRGEPLPA